MLSSSAASTSAPPAVSPSPLATKPAIYSAYSDHSAGLRVNTDSVVYNALRDAHKDVPITIVPEWNCNLTAYAAAGFATVELAGATPAHEQLKWTVYVPPPNRGDGGSGTVAEEVFFDAFLYQWQQHEFLVYLVDGRDGTGSYPTVRNQYVLGDAEAVRALVAQAGQYQGVLHDEVWVFNQGMWEKDRSLYRAIMKSRWEDVILDRSLKENLIATVEGFFDTRDQYHRLRVPWKRGLLFYGPPGNGKTISIKATMHTLYARDPPVPTMYVKSLASFAPPEFSIESIFTMARQQAPCYLVFEDLDSLVTDSVRSFFLNAVDGLAENEGILMVGSTNHLERLDPGIAKRPSRFDRKYLFPDPNYAQRVRYCQFWQRKLRDNPDVDFPDAICTAAAKMTDRFSFAFIQEAFVSALMEIAREGGMCARPDEVDALADAWHVLDVADTHPASDWDKGKDQDLDDFVLWRKLKHEIQLLRDELEPESAVSRS